MANITAKDVAALRAKTGLGMMECKKALVEAEGDAEKAIKILREKGLATASKKESRIAAEGIVDVMTVGTTTAMIEVNSETDFVAKNESFRAFVKDLLSTIIANKPADMDAFMEMTCAGAAVSVKDTLVEKIAQIGEKISIRRFVIGLGKKVLIANVLAECTADFAAADTQSVLFYWIYAIAFALHIYFDFSGYSDMAIGLGKIFGFHFIENFNYPYMSKSIGEFWRRWHMSLGSWFRDYVYIPLGGNRVSRGRWVFNTLVVWMLTGLWHGAAWNFVLWGLLYAAFLLLEKFVPQLLKLPEVLRRTYVLLIVVLGFVLFNATTLTEALTDIGGMFGFMNAPLVTDYTLYCLRSYGPLLVVAMIGATPLVKNLAAKLENKPIGAILEPVMTVLLLLLCTAYLVDGSFNPFLYFRF